MKEHLFLLIPGSKLFSDDGMREKDVADVVRRVEKVFRNKEYQEKVDGSDKRWLDDEIEDIFDTIIRYLKSLEDYIL